MNIIIINLAKIYTLKENLGGIMLFIPRVQKRKNSIRGKNAKLEVYVICIQNLSTYSIALNRAFVYI